MKFEDLDIGDMFNTKRYRLVKINDDEALVVMGVDIGAVVNKSSFIDSTIVILYSRKEALNKV